MTNAVATLDRQNRELAPPEVKFVLEYLVDFDPVRAYGAVYGVRSNATVVAKRLLADPAVMRRVALELEAHGRELFLKKEAILYCIWTEALNQNNKTADRLKAMELAARMIGALDHRNAGEVPKVNITIIDPTHVIVKGETADGQTVQQEIEGTVVPHEG